MDYKLDEYNSLEDGPKQESIPGRGLSDDNTTLFGDISAFEQESQTATPPSCKAADDFDIREIK